MPLWVRVSQLADRAATPVRTAVAFDLWPIKNMGYELLKQSLTRKDVAPPDEVVESAQTMILTATIRNMFPQSDTYDQTMESRSKFVVVVSKSELGLLGKSQAAIDALLALFTISSATPTANPEEVAKILSNMNSSHFKKEFPWSHLVGLNHFKKLLAVARASAEGSAAKRVVEATFDQAEHATGILDMAELFPYVNNNLKVWLRNAKSLPEEEATVRVARVVQCGLMRWDIAAEAARTATLEILRQPLETISGGLETLEQRGSDIDELLKQVLTLLFVAWRQSFRSVSYCQ